jgi:hypothetical protein
MWLIGGDPTLTDEEQFRELTVLVQALRRSVEERPPRGIGHISNEQWRQTLLAFEEVRLILRQASRRSSKSRIDAEFMEEAHQKLSGIASNPVMHEIISALKLLNMPFTSRERPMFEKYRGMPAIDALHSALDFSSYLSMPTPQQAFDLEDGSEFRRLYKIVPEQKVSPAKFAIDGSRIVVLDQKHQELPEDLENVTAARSHLHVSGQNIIEALKSSNCDRRLIEGLENLQAYISSQGNVIELGLTNISCEAMFASAEDELPEAICGRVKGHTTAVGMFIAQFPEWQRFSENAAAISLSSSDVEEINRAASQIISRIENRPEIADAKVPHTIRAIRRLSADPGGTLKSAAFALLRTIENFVSTVFSFGADFIETTANKTSEKLSTAVSKAAVVALMSAAIAGVGQMTGVTGKVAEASWMKTAVEIVQKQVRAIE